MRIEIVDDENCPRCNGGAEFYNRPKVHDGANWWWKCYNPACEVGYYCPDTGEVELS